MTLRPFHQQGHLYFITVSISGWKCLFYEPEFINIILGSLDFLRKEKRHYLYSFVVMPNHVHFINKPYEKYTISDNIQNFASYTAHEILKLLRKDGKEGLINFFYQEALALQAGTPGGAKGGVETSLPLGCQPARRTGKAGGKRAEREVNGYKHTSEKGKINMDHEAGYLPRSRTRPRVRGETNHKIWQDIQAKNIYSLSVLEQKMEYTHSNPCNKKWRLVQDRADYKYSSACFYDKGIKPIIEVDDVRELYK